MLDRLKGPIFELFDWLTGNGNMYSTVISFFAVAVIIFVVFPIRECARGYVAKALGDDTAEREGRLTLNPISHVDPMGALFLCLSCFGWSKHMPISIHRCKKVKTRTAVLLTSFAGPVANILMGLIFMIVYKILLLNFDTVGNVEVMACVIVAIGQIITLNVWLGILDLLPIPPYDGCTILCCFLPRGGVQFFERYGQYLNWGFLILLLSGLMDYPLGVLMDGVIWVLDKATFFIL